MTLQNRVAPDGSLHAVAARGMFTGNRGIVHDPDMKTLNGRRWTTKAWIICACNWNGRKRDVWGSNHTNANGEKRPGWSELFFLDEVTGVAAGHRPCFFCRREAATHFKTACNPVETSNALDEQLHLERRLSAKTPPQRLSAIDLPGLPDGTIVDAGGQFFALKDRRALPWSFAGYASGVGLGDLVRNSVTLVTPKLVTRALRAGYKPVWHESAG